MGLVHKDELGQAVFYSPAKIAEARARLDAAEAEKEAERVRKEQEKLRKAAEKDCKAELARERALKSGEEAALKAQAKEDLKKARAQQKQVDKQLADQQQASKSMPTPSKRSQKRKTTSTLDVAEKRMNLGTTHTGRQIALPRRFRGEVASQN